MSSAARAEQTLALPRETRALEQAQRFAALAVSHCRDDCREAVTLAVCELGENLIKYGGGGDPRYAGIIGVTVEGDKVRVRAVNPVSSHDDAERVRELVHRISDSGADVRDLYRARLQELFLNPSLPRAQLGLLRMAFEGGFRLSCLFEPPELEIIAERVCSAP